MDRRTKDYIQRFGYMRTKMNNLSSPRNHTWVIKTDIPVEQAGASQPGLHCEQSPVALSHVSAQPSLHCS